MNIPATLALVPMPTSGHLAGRYTFTSPDRLITVLLDDEQQEWWVECHPDASPANVGRVLDSMVYALGYDLLSEDEDEPEERPDGSLRIFCVPALAVLAVAPEVHDSRTEDDSSVPLTSADAA